MNRRGLFMAVLGMLGLSSVSRNEQKATWREFSPVEIEAIRARLVKTARDRKMAADAGLTPMDIFRQFESIRRGGV